ncbi:FtsK/SpoIIIE family DNA translocase [Clostridium oryzae]|uniref:DNA translocase SpoIIIE n=1 Tax=Clostridium oryzae TaxID=1450648 RepID=A0A1V4IPS2_9CLOT|nr:DNA translocase SpoIIIE [Clostridium oryzae]
MSRKKTSKPDYYNDIFGIFLVALGIIMFYSVISNKAGIFGQIIRMTLLLVFGIGSYVLPLIVVLIGIGIIAANGKITFKKNFYGIVFAIVNTMLFVQLINLKYYYSGEFAKGIFKFYNENQVLNGGIISYSIIVPMYKLLGYVGCYVLLIAFYIVSLILIFNVTIADFIKIIKQKSTDKRKVRRKKEPSNEKPVVEEPPASDKNKFISSVNKKIKLMDFMKNSTLDSEEDSVKAEQEAAIEINDYSPQRKEEGNNNKLNDEISRELSQKLQSPAGDSIEYKFPSVDLLNENKMVKTNKEDKRGLLASAEKLEETLNSFGVDAKVIQVTKGPSVIRYELQPSAGVKVSKIVNLSDDIALSLAARGVRIEAPIPGKSAVGIEVPNKELIPVYLREVLESDEFTASNKNISFALGKDIGGKCVVTDLSKMPHLLIAGATGSGKSVCINTLIISLLYKASPDEVKLLMIDPKVVELSVYNGIPHLLIPVVTEPKKAAGALNWAVNEMTRRYKLFADNSVRNIDGYNELVDKGKLTEKLPWIVIIVDELADLMMVCPGDVEDYIGRLAQMARAAGMHLVIATQRPSVDVITGVIKANIPSRISFAVSSQIDSRTILDSSGAEKLLGKGDMLFFPVGMSKPLRIQGAFVSEEEVEKIVNFIKSQQQNEVEYKEEIIEHIENGSASEQEEDKDELFDDAVKVVVESGQASTSLLQRRLKIGFNRASRIMDQLEAKQIISGRDGAKPRQVLMDRNEYSEMQNNE